MGEAVLSFENNENLKSVVPTAKDDPRVVSHDPDLSQFMSFSRTLLVPMFIWKVSMLYFGLNYSMYPGEGYGYGLVATIFASLSGFAYFLWRNRKAQ